MPRATITDIPQGLGAIFIPGRRVIRTRLQQIPQGLTIGEDHEGTSDFKDNV